MNRPRRGPTVESDKDFDLKFDDKNTVDQIYLWGTEPRMNSMQLTVTHFFT